MTLWLDRTGTTGEALRCEVRHVGGPAHTTNDSIVWIPELAVLFAGDLLFDGEVARRASRRWSVAAGR